jgi:hypothetical protein
MYWYSVFCYVFRHLKYDHQAVKHGPDDVGAQSSKAEKDGAVYCNRRGDGRAIWTLSQQDHV